MDDGEWGAPFQSFQEQRERGYYIFAQSKKWAGSASALFQSAHTASVNTVYSGWKKPKKRSGTTETNVVVDVVRRVVVPIRRTDVVIVVVPRAAPKHALWRPHINRRYSLKMP